MYVCLCKGVTDSQIKQSINNGATSLRQVRKELGVATQCCKCLPEARAIVDEALAAQQYSETAFPLAASGDIFYPA